MAGTSPVQAITTNPDGGGLPPIETIASASMRLVVEVNISGGRRVIHSSLRHRRKLLKIESLISVEISEVATSLPWSKYLNPKLTSN